MANGISFLKPSGLLLLAAFFVVLVPANGSPLTTPILAGQRLSLQPWLTVLEDSAGSATAGDLLRRPNAFVPLPSLQKGDPTSYYWLRADIRTNDLYDPGRILSFSHLTFVDVYLYDDTGLIVHKVAGAFRPRSNLADGDGRQYVMLPLEKNKTYTLLIRVHHTKHYQPVFDFEMMPGRQYFNTLGTKEAFDAALMGAVTLFFVYTLLSWIVSRFRPYLWLLLSIGGIGLYVIGMNGYWIDWFSPEHPAAGWLLNVHFLHLGMLGLYLLVTDFWHLKQDFPGLYAWGRWIPLLLGVSSLACFGIDYFTGNYSLASNLTCAEHPLILAFILASLFICGPRLSAAQRYLAYGIALCSIAGVFVTLNAVINHERSLPSVSLVGDCIILTVFLLFSTGLKEEMRHHELAKQVALEELNRLQQHQNTILEKKVEERTDALRISNKRLLNQKHLLAERNTKIELLINELNHRVKNNLQLLYSLLSLQLPLVRDGVSRDILQGNIGKIRAMMLVNQKLFNFEKGRGIGLCEFITELAVHLQKIYDTKEKTRIVQNIPAGLRLSDKHTLSFGLILSELFTNTFKHAFRDQPDPCICVEAVAVTDQLLEFHYSDNGVGIPAGEQPEKFTMGIPLIKDLTRQMNGQMTVRGDKGLSYSFTIPV
ncbi:MAG TPA: histidine kinase dimerization/phosphoacceptor domain -containing protein [Puia sp.]|nr:histidine kinase dimerization/phosphoacceptor domain -containing protein [Puia sp.]